MATPMQAWGGNAMGYLGPGGSMMTNDQSAANKLGLPLMSGSASGPGWGGNQIWGGMPIGRFGSAMPSGGAASAPGMPSSGGAPSSMPPGASWGGWNFGNGGLATGTLPGGSGIGGTGLAGLGGTGAGGGGSNFLSNIMQNQPPGVQMPSGLSSLFSGLNQLGGPGQSVPQQTGGNSIFRPPGGTGGMPSAGGGSPGTQSAQRDMGGGPGSGFYAGYDATPYGGAQPQSQAATSSPMQNLLSSVTAPAQTGTPSFAGPAPQAAATNPASQAAAPTSSPTGGTPSSYGSTVYNGAGGVIGSPNARMAGPSAGVGTFQIGDTPNQFGQWQQGMTPAATNAAYASPQFAQQTADYNSGANQRADYGGGGVFYGMPQASGMGPQNPFSMLNPTGFHI